MRGVLSLFVIVLLVGGNAWGQDAEPVTEVERLATDAAQAYRAAEYQKAVDLLEHAYQLVQLPSILYNTAKAYDKLGNLAKAESLYRRYIDASNSDPQNADPRVKMKAEERLQTIVGMRKAREEKQVAEKVPARPPTLQELREQEQHQRVLHDRYIALGVGIGAVVSLGVAIGLSVDANAVHSQFVQETSLATKRDLRDRSRAEAIAGDVFYGVSATAMAVSAYFIYCGFRPLPGSSPLAVAPYATPSSAGVAVGGSF